jgi:methylated-DNA-[protein]-cysteine S-methyltransferase
MLETFRLERLNTPTGLMLIITGPDDNLRAADWEDHEDRLWRLLRRHYGGTTTQLKTAPRKSPGALALQAYFDGDLDAITNIPVANNGTDFQREVWAALRRIPTGQTLTYGALAVKLGRPTSMRAVGLANGANPISIVVPCHRVIGANGSLTGYGGGIERKRWLLAHEAKRLS